MRHDQDTGRRGQERGLVGPRTGVVVETGGVGGFGGARHTGAGAVISRRLDGVGRRYGLRGPWVLRGVDLDVCAGTLLRVDGANGSGKSTLLRLLAGIDAPSEGDVGGRPRTAFVPERFPARLPFTASAYLTRLGRVHGLSRAAARRGARDWMERFGAAEHLRTPLSELSKGSSQKVAVAQALLAEPELLVLDEAWTGLDAAARAELDRAVLERAAAGGAVVFVDHAPRGLAGAADVTYTVVGGALRLGGTGDDPGSGNGTGSDSGPGTDSGSGSGSGEMAGVPRMVCIEVVAMAAGAGPGAGPRGDADPVADAVAAVVAGLGAASAAYVTALHTPAGTVRLTAPAGHSDAVLRALLTARTPWHVLALNADPEVAAELERAPELEPAPEPAPAREPAPETGPEAEGGGAR